MASAEEFAQLKKTVQELRRGQLDLILRVETLEDRVASLEKGGGGGGGGGAAAAPPQPEPILTCVQCAEEYTESRNAEGSCKYHSAALKGVGWDYKFPCCDKKTRNYDAAKSIPGCTKGRHCSKHHTDYTYAAYFTYMMEQSKKAKELWMTLNVQDYVTERTEWGEVGVTDTGKVYILVGTSRVELTAYADFSCEDLRQLKEERTVAVSKTDPIGWELRAEVTAEGGTARAITVTLKPAHSATPLVKQVELVMDGETPRPGKIETLSDPTSVSAGKSYAVPSPVQEGPILDAGQDFSKDRKNDYEVETTEGCPLAVQQHGNTEAASGTRMRNGKWNNLFTAKLKVTNTSQQNIAVTEVTGEYLNKDGEWMKCEEVFVGQEGWRGSYNWFDTPNFSLDPAATGSLAVRLAIPFDDNPPSSNYEGRRAHHSLPQPLHLRTTFKDQNKATATIRFEQGNPPLDIATRETREKNWGKGSLEFHLFADDMEGRKRSDAALYYDDKGVLCFRPAVNGDSSQYFFISSSVPTMAYKAKKAGQKEVEFENMKKENKGSSVRVFLAVDEETGNPYAIKVVITTPTSSATGYYLLRQDDPSSAQLSVTPEQVGVKSDITVNFTVPRASKNDRFVIYPHLGKSSVGKAVTNKEAVTTGSVKMKSPDAPGQYEVRYYPAWMDSQYTGARHSGYWGLGPFSVST